jgi:MFS family permease
MSLAAETTPKHSLGRRLLAFLAVDLTLTTGFMLGNVLAGHIPLDTVYLARMSLTIFGIQAGCILVWLGFDAIRRRIDLSHFQLPRISLRRPWWRVRARIRKRLIRDRSKHDYRSAEGAIVVPVVLVGGLFSLSLFSTNMTMATVQIFLHVFLAAAVIFLTTTVAYQYRGAADKPVSTMIAAAIFGLVAGYVFELV